MAYYGVPYMGSKDKICDELIKVFPNADHFYDLFGGGFSVSHAMLLRRSKDYKHFHFNEIRPGICELIKKAINGDFNYNVFKPPFIDRETFFKNIDTDPMIKILWSFGNNGRDYLFSKEIEPYKKSMHNAIVFNESDSLAEKTLGMSSFKDGYDIKAKRLFLRNKIEYYRKTRVPEFLWPYLDSKSLAIVKKQDKPEQLRQLEQLEQLQRLERLQQLQQLQQLERLERLQQLQQLERLQQLQRLNFYSLSYEQIKIEKNSVIYCDPPYAGTADYGGQFDHKDFFDWCDAQENPVFISEYNISDKRFTCIKQIKKRSLLSSNKSLNNKMEKIYINRAARSLILSK